MSSPARAPAPPSAADARPVRLLAPRISWIYLAAAVGLSGLYAAGWFDQAVYSVMLTGTCIGVAIGVRRNRPQRQWHWWAFVLATLLWSAAGITREAVSATGVLTSDRSLLPDAFALPAYLVVGIALTGLLRTTRYGDRDRDAWLDGAVVALGALQLAFVLALRPMLSDEEAWLPAQVAVAVYPPVSAVLVAIACRLAFGSSDRSPAHQMMFAGVVCLLLGDICFAMAEVGTLAVARVYELPFMLSAALFGAGALHPSMRHVNRPTTAQHGRLTRPRVVVLAIALVLPALVAELVPPTSVATRWFLRLNMFALAVAAAARLLSTVRAQSESESLLVYQATHDELTGLPNRSLALAHIDERLRRNERSGASLAVMFADVDRFKLINDSMGHSVGDELLIAAAQRFREAVRADDLVARISGDEFLIVCDGVDVDVARALVQRIRGAFNDSFELSAGTIYATTSIGVAVSEPHSLANGPSLVRDADTAMYHSKVTGRDSTTFFDVDMRNRLERRVALEHAMRQALERGEFVPWFQPIVGLPAGQVQGFEALARWPQQLGLVSPAEFVPIAEESGMIVALGASILDQSCAQIAAWRRSMPGAEDAYVSVNLSPRQLIESDIVDTVADTLERWGLPGSALTLEITEGVMMEDTVETQAVLNAVAALGVSLSVDDFGTGFSSLSYLKHYPVSRVKIDKSFVDGLDELEADHSLVVAIIAMADALGLSTVAEGVERAAQASRLFQLGCTDAQGYYFARAHPADEIPSVVDALGRTPRVTRD